jgi:hypothetical protein
VNSGPAFIMRRGAGGHVPVPVPGSCKRKDGEAADLRVEAHYPVFADCRNCQGQISLDRLMQMEWRHVQEKQP